MKFIVDKDIKPDYYMFKLDSNREILESALDIVRDYIISNNLMVVGGMAIDLSLKIKDSGIYSLYEIPDYDIVSPENVKHANAVGELLCKYGVSDVAIIPAVHKTTMRVQIYGYTVFDSTYLPIDIYSNIPTLECEPFTVVHPVYQMIDQLLSLSMLWQITGPDFNIFNRLEKDASRYKLLNEHYRLEVKPIRSIDKEVKTLAPINQIVNKGNAMNYDISQVYHGQIAYGIYADLYKKITKKDIFTLGKFNYIGAYEVLVQHAPKSYNRFEKGYSSVKPDCYIEGDCKKLVLTNFTINKIEDMYVASPYYVMSYCLYMNFHSDDPLWNNMFHGLNEMLSCQEVSELSIESVGIEYWKDENYEFFARNYESMIKEKKSIAGVPPKNYLQAPDCNIKKTFDPYQSEFYDLHRNQDAKPDSM